MPGSVSSALIKVLEDEKDEELLAALNEVQHALLASIEDPEIPDTSVLLLLGWYAHPALMAH